MKEFELLDIATADMAFAAYGSDLNELFSNAAKAITSIMFDGKIEQKIVRTMELEEKEDIVLLQKWLSEIVYLHESEGLLFSKFDVKTDGRKLKAVIYGEKYDKKRHKFIIDVKAVTYHKMSIDKTKGGYKCTVVVDV
jgi:SHS2 domain-containing protein